MPPATLDSTKKKAAGASKWLSRLLFALLSVVLVVLIMAPTAIKTGAQQWLSEQTQGAVTIGEVKLNLFAGKFSLRGLTIPSRDTAQTPDTSIEYASVEIDMSALLRQEIVVEGITLSHARIIIDRTKEQLEIAGITIPRTAPDATAPTTATSSTPKFAINSIRLEAVTLDYRSDDISKAITIDDTTIKNISTLQSADSIQVAVTLEIDNSQIDYQGEVRLFTEEPSLQGTLAVTRLNIASFNALIPQSEFVINDVVVSLQTAVSGMLPKKGAPHFKIAGQSTLSNIDIASRSSGEPLLQLASIEFSKIELEYPHSKDPSSDAMQVTLNIGIDKGRIDYQGELFVFADTPAFRGDLNISAFDITPFSPLIPLPDLALNDLNASLQSTFDGTFPKQGSPILNLTGHSTLNNLDITSTLHSDTYVKLKTVEVKQIDVQYPARISIGAIVLKDLNSSIFRDSEGNLLSKPQTDPAATETATTTPASQENTATPLALAIDSLSIEGNSSLLFKDAAVTPEFNIKLQPIALSVGRIDTTQVNAETPVSLSANINDNGTIKMKGKVTPLAEELMVTLNTHLTGLALPTLSPYTEKYIGYELRRGRLGVESDLSIKSGQLQANNKLTLTKLSIKESDPEKAQGLIKQLEMPLDSALDLLRDKDENITFTLPVEGRLDDPQFKLDGVIKLALGKGMKMAAMNYLAGALQPLGTILLAKDLFGVATKPRFKSLDFNPGDANLSKEMQAYLDKIGELLKKRPQLAITLCGIANGSDRSTIAEKEATVQQQRLHALAKTRGDNARTYLIEQQDVALSRLFECNPKVKANTESNEGLIEGVEIFL